MNFIVVRSQKLSITKLKQIWQEDVFEVKLQGNFTIYHTSSSPLLADENSEMVFEGWFGNYTTGYSPQELLTELKFANWPLSSNFTGSFSAVLINGSETIIANDLLGMLPLYYYEKEEFEAYSNSLLAFSVLKAVELDPVGIYQRRFSQNYNNFGSRTIIKHVKRLLPGEFVRFQDGEVCERKYDGTLYNYDASEKQNLEGVGEAYWKFVEREYRIGLKAFDVLYVGLSGGIDSRFMVSLLPKEKEKVLVTYGSYLDEIEVKIAKNVAKKVKNSGFNFTAVNEAHFPKPEDVNFITGNTESYYNNHWLPFFNFLKEANTTNANLLIGDMCEAIPGKFVSTSMDKNNKLKNIFKTPEYKHCSKQSFDTWKEKTLQLEFKPFKQYKDHVFFNHKVEEILEETKKDIEQVFEIVAKHQPPLVELYEECYQWFTYIRMVHSKQFSIHKNRISIINPSLFFGNLREISKIHPSLRVNYVLMDYYFKNKKGPKSLARIPVAQAPMVPYNAPRVLRLLFWGIRATIDRVLVRRKLKNRSLTMRYRLYKSLDWPQIYQQIDARENLERSIPKDYVNALDVLRIYNNRKNMITTPLTTFDISLIVGLNTEIQMFHSSKK